MTRTVVVSGGGTGIGREIARTFALDGERVAIVARREDVLKQTAEEINAETGVDLVRWYHADLCDPAEVEAATGAILDAHEGLVDVLVNNAGGIVRGATASLAEVRVAWEEDLRRNVLPAVLLTTALVPHLRRPGGRVVTISSIAAMRGGGDSYSAAKAALIGWTYSLAAELGPAGVTVNAVAPGYVTGTEFFEGTMTPERHERLVGETLDGRPGRPEDVAATVRFLASEDAGHLTGQILQPNGGAVLGR